MDSKRKRAAVSAKGTEKFHEELSSVRATFHVREDLLNEVRDAAVALSGPPLRLTLAQLANDALEREVKRLQKAHNRGKAFPRRKENSKGGRPIGS